MAAMPIHIYGDPCLREKAQAVEAVSEEVRQLVRDMGETMYGAKGIGLAAPQVGVGLRLFVSDVSYEREEDGSTVNRHLKAFINPEVVWESEEDEPYMEGCLSVPEVEGEVYRPSSIRLRYLDEKGKAHERLLEGIEARCAQHEIDHLDGILFVDRVAPLKRRLLAGKLNRLKQTGAEAASG